VWGGATGGRWQRGEATRVPPRPQGGGVERHRGDEKEEEGKSR
jgi:hypothetical protein